MPRRIPGVVEKYEFIDSTEINDAMTFSPMQIMYLQSMQASLMQETVALSREGAQFDNPERFLRECCFYRGKIELLEEILSNHEILEAAKRRDQDAKAALEAFRDARTKAFNAMNPDANNTF